jgi:hypothetical protein
MSGAPRPAALRAGRKLVQQCRGRRWFPSGKVRQDHPKGPAKKARGAFIGLSRKGCRWDTRSPGVGPPSWIFWRSKAPRFFRAPLPFARAVHGEPLVRRSADWAQNLRAHQVSRFTTKRCPGGGRVGLLRRSTQRCLSAFGRYGRRLRGVSRGHQSASRRTLESRCRIAHSRRVRPKSAAERGESHGPREELPFTVCPGSALGCRSSQATLGSKSGLRLRLEDADGT